MIYLIRSHFLISDFGQKRKFSALISGFWGEDQANPGKSANARYKKGSFTRLKTTLWRLIAASLPLPQEGTAGQSLHH